MTKSEIIKMQVPDPLLRARVHGIFILETLKIIPELATAMRYAPDPKDSELLFDYAEMKGLQRAAQMLGRHGIHDFSLEQPVSD